MIPFQHIKSIVTSNSVILMDTGHPVLEEFVPDLQVGSNLEVFNKQIHNNKLVCVMPSSASFVNFSIAIATSSG